MTGLDRETVRPSLSRNARIAIAAAMLVGAAVDPVSRLRRP